MEIFEHSSVVCKIELMFGIFLRIKFAILNQHIVKSSIISISEIKVSKKHENYVSIVIYICFGRIKKTIDILKYS